MTYYMIQPLCLFPSRLGFWRQILQGKVNSCKRLASCSRMTAQRQLEALAASLNAVSPPPCIPPMPAVSRAGALWAETACGGLGAT